MLIAAAALSITSCQNNGNTESPSGGSSYDGSSYENSQTDESTSDTSSSAVTEIGEGSTKFNFTVFDGEKETAFLVKTDKKTVGEALIDVRLISGEQGAYGLYVKTVNGVTADYDKDGKYWAFYINGEYAMTGVDSTDIVSGDSYAFKIES